MERYSTVHVRNAREGLFRATRVDYNPNLLAAWARWWRPVNKRLMLANPQVEGKH